MSDWENRAVVEMARLCAALADLVRFEDDLPHHHEVPGVWDEDNGPALGGRPCERCAAFETERALVGGAG